MDLPPQPLCKGRDTFPHICSVKHNQIRVSTLALSAQFCKRLSMECNLRSISASTLTGANDGQRDWTDGLSNRHVCSVLLRLKAMVYGMSDGVEDSFDRRASGWKVLLLGHRPARGQWVSVTFGAMSAEQ